MEMAIAEIETAMSVAVLKHAQNAASAEVLTLLQALPQVPSIDGMGATVDISV
jgi:hypothetical protein